ncbi:pyridoxal-phosphate dependent enzyme [Kitasatospora sp. SUK 42]|uniref:pyridoxal-phosphate dependent enzyme n=1 Tax=Kitasatospora sp. SUK 42 TaxID=1588882 RepID=UPI001C31468F|nr:pyridoxal-phosphate dependent enzyme [Kitasatospora sp. SUK 42]MBV2155621.1 pyridoxal-phosphate dependent enzyme [Kitasatospora sp. SUK 42]
MHQLAYGDVKAATDRIAGRIRPVALTSGEWPEWPEQPGELWLALEFMQHTGSFKARGAQNFLQAHRETGALPDAGVTIASGGNAGLACAWAARQQGVRATVFLPTTAPAVKVARLRGYGAEVRLVGSEYAEALAACEEFTAATGALAAHAYDHPLIAAGARTLLEEIRSRIPGLDTVVVSVGARRASASALHAAQQDGAHSVLVPDAEIVRARQALWDDRRIVVEHGAATALAALSGLPGRYRPAPGEKVCVVLCGANTDPSDLVGQPAAR